MNMPNQNGNGYPSAPSSAQVRRPSGRVMQQLPEDQNFRHLVDGCNQSVRNLGSALQQSAQSRDPAPVLQAFSTFLQFASALVGNPTQLESALPMGGQQRVTPRQVASLMESYTNLVALSRGDYGKVLVHCLGQQASAFQELSQRLGRAAQRASSPSSSSSRIQPPHQTRQAEARGSISQLATQTLSPSPDQNRDPVFDLRKTSANEELMKRFIGGDIALLGAELQHLPHNSPQVLEARNRLALRFVDIITESSMRMGDYQITGVCGIGAMSTVYKAHHIKRPHVPVAFRVLRDHIGQIDERVEEVLGQDRRETDGLSNLMMEGEGHFGFQYVCKFHEVGQFTVQIAHPSPQGFKEIEVPYKVMEYLEGTDLQERINLSRGSNGTNGAEVREKKAFTDQQVLETLHKVSAGLACAHRAGLVHRDIKPANILDSAKHGLRVTDFGMARVYMEGDGDNDSGGHMSVTANGEAVGTPATMSPEQFATPQDPRRNPQYDIFDGTCFPTDIWSAAQTLLFMILHDKNILQAHVLDHEFAKTLDLTHAGMAQASDYAMVLAGHYYSAKSGDVNRSALNVSGKRFHKWLSDNPTYGPSIMKILYLMFSGRSCDRPTAAAVAMVTHEMLYGNLPEQYRGRVEEEADQTDLEHYRELKAEMDKLTFKGGKRKSGKKKKAAKPGLLGRITGWLRKK